MLEQEYEAFHRILPELLKSHRGEFALIKGDAIEFLPTEDAALDAGYRRFGLEQPFLVQQVTDDEPALYVSRAVAPCR